MLSATMFGQLLRRSETATPALQKQAYQYATRTNNADLLVLLATTPTLDPEIDIALSQRDELDVLLAWAGRRGRSQSEVVERFSNEKRATLLLSLAYAKDLPADLYEQFAKRKSVNVNWALLTNPSVSDDLKQRLAASLGQSTTIQNSSLYERLSPLSNVSDAVYVAFVSNCSNAYALGVLARDINESTPLERVTALAASAERISNTPEWAHGGYDVLARLLGVSDLSDEARLVVESAAERVVATESGRNAYGVTTALHRSRLRRQIDVDQMLDDIRTAGSLSALNDQIARFEGATRDAGVRFDHTAFSVAVISNPHCDQLLMQRNRYGFTEESAYAHARSAVARGDLALAQTVFQICQFNGIDVFSRMYAEADVPSDLVSWVIGDDKEAPEYVLRARAVVEDKDVAIRVLPAATTMKDVRYSELIAGMLTETLGEDAEKWHMFTSLADEWVGSFTGLLDAADSLSDK